MTMISEGSKDVADILPKLGREYLCGFKDSEIIGDVIIPVDKYFPKNPQYIALLFWRELVNHSVTGASVHAPIHRNSMYVHTVIRYINKTRRPEHAHSPVRRYKQLPQGP